MKPLDLLTKREFGKENKPLFRNQSDIVETIFLIENHDFSNKQSLRAFVNQTINGERKLSEKLKNALFQILPERIGNPEQLSELKEKIIESFESNFNKKVISKSSDFDHLLMRAERADTIFIITPEPAEIKNNQIATDLKKELLERVGLIEGKGKQAKYVFYFPKPLIDETQSIAFRFWKGLYDFMIDYGISDPIDKLTKINQGKNAKLEVYSVERDFCWLPVAVYDIGMPSELAFIVLYYSEMGKEKSSVAKFAGYSFKEWKELIFNKLKKIKDKEEDDDYNERGDKTIISVPFKSIVEHIEKNEGIL